MTYETTPPAVRAQAAHLHEVRKEYPAPDGAVTALAATTLGIARGELTLICGPSGSGKTTLLSILGCVTYPTAGTVVIDGHPVPFDDREALAALRRTRIGFVFQGYNLLAPLTALENVRLPLDLGGVPRRSATERAMSALDRLGLASHAGKRPSALSGGQQQRVAIARAVVTAPPLILCDEPTAALDHRSAERVMDELRTLAHLGAGVVVVTHDPRLEAYADRILDVTNGRAAQRTPRPAKGARHAA